MSVLSDEEILRAQRHARLSKSVGRGPEANPYPVTDSGPERALRARWIAEYYRNHPDPDEADEA